ncbi:MAG: hypothetical protein AB1894_27630 [Chloroflexota bacterium]
MPEKQTTEHPSIDTGGGAYTGRDANVSGNFTGRDTHVHGDLVYGDKIAPGKPAKRKPARRKPARQPPARPPSSFASLFWGGLIGFLLGILGNLLANWMQGEIFGNLFTPARIAVIAAAAFVGLLIAAWLSSRQAPVESAAPGRRSVGVWLDRVTLLWSKLVARGRNIHFHNVKSLGSTIDIDTNQDSKDH